MTLTSLAPAPTRAHTNITIAFGLVNINVAVSTGTESTKVTRKEFLNGDASVSVGRAPVVTEADGTKRVVDTADVTRMAQATNGAWVIWTDEEGAECTSPKGLAEIQAFVPLKDTGKYLTEGLLQVRPRKVKGKVDVAAERAFALLLAAMKSRKVAALVKVAMRGPARFALLTPEGNLLLILTADAVREAQPLPTVKPSDAEVAMGIALIEAVGIDTPVITDDTAPVVQAAVDAKATGLPAPVKAETPAIPQDIMAALEASIDARKAKAVA